MGKAPCVLLCVAVILGFAVGPARIAGVRAQTAPLQTCSGTLTSSPMQGRYTGPWHSDADYHFAVFNTDLDLTITIDGTLDITVTPDGRVSGVAKGTVDAPIHHDGIRDVSSGTGTISGIVQGMVTPGSSTLTLVQPVIAMQWGTFIPNGYTVPRSITMPDYQLPTSRADCVSLQGAISEQNFPTQFVVADGASGLTQAAGIGAATGTWSLSHVDSATFRQLSQQIDSFLLSANAALAGSSGAPLSAATFDTSVLQPLKALLASIEQNPDVARCLLERLNAWIVSTVPSLRSRAQSLASSSDLADLRQASDLDRFAQSLQLACLVPEDGTLNAISAAEGSALDRAVSARDWSATALAAREIILSTPDPPAVTQRFANDVHDLLQGALTPAQRLDAARVAYALGDTADAQSGSSAPAEAATYASHVVLGAAKKHKKRKSPVKPTPTRTPTPRPTSTPKPTSTPTATATPVSLAATLQTGAAGMTTHTSSSATPSFSWQPVNGATRYVVLVSTVAPGALSWSWSGTGASVQYGDTSLPDLPGSAGEVWPVALPSSGYTWSVLALDADGHIIGLALRLSS